MPCPEIAAWLARAPEIYSFALLTASGSRIPLCQIRRDGAGEGAARSVGVGIVDPPALEPAGTAPSAYRRSSASLDAVPALYKHGAAVGLADALCRRQPYPPRSDIDMPERTSASGMFGVTRAASGNSSSSSAVHRVRFSSGARAAGSHHDRVHHNISGPVITAACSAIDPNQFL